MDKAAAAFGSIGSPESEEGVEEKSGLDQLYSKISKKDFHDDIMDKATS